MSTVGQKERETQDRVINFFQDRLRYTYLGNWEIRPNNSNIEEEILIDFLTQKGYSSTLINKALHELKVTAGNYN